MIRKFIASRKYIVLKWSLSNANPFILQILQLTTLVQNVYIYLKCQILEHCWLWLIGWAEVPGLHHQVGEDGGGQGHSEVQLAKEGGLSAPWDQAPVRILDKHMSGEA